MILEIATKGNFPTNPHW